jgi:hypothetical protein
MKSNSTSSRVSGRYGMIEALEPRIAPAAIANISLPPVANLTFVTVTAGGSLLMKAGEVLTTGSAAPAGTYAGGTYLLYVAQGEVLVHTTDLNSNSQLDFNEITGLSVGNGASFVSFVDIHGSVATDLNPDGTLTDGGKGDILLDYNIAEINLRSLAATDFTATQAQSSANLVDAHLAMSSYSIFGNIYAGGGVGLSTTTSSGLQIDTSGTGFQTAIFNGGTGSDNNFYQAAEPVIGSIYVGTSATGQSFSFGSSGSASDVFGNFLAFNPSSGEAGASIYNINATSAFSIGTIHAGNGGFNAPGGSVVNAALQGDNAGTYKLIAGNAGSGTTGQSGGSIINFSEAGATISEVILQSGNGGTGLTGAGGDAGVITLNPSSSVNINAHVTVNLGSGGNGYTKGGAGGSASTGAFVTPNGQLTTALNLVTTWHNTGTIGSTQAIDFNGPHAPSDAVFSTTNPNQVVVAMGESAGGLNASSYIFLNAPADVDSITVGDFTGNGHPDIAVASGAAGYAGVYVYLSQYSPAGAFTGFSSPLFSPLPSLVLTSTDYLYTSTPITKIVAGDFAGNGAEGLAVLAQETNAVTFTVDSVLIFLTGETNTTHPHGSGYFYANFANANIPYEDLSTLYQGFSATNSIFEATALKTFTPGSGHDVLLEANLGSNTFDVISDNLTGAPVLNTTSFGVVSSGGGNPTNFKVLGLTVTEDQNTLPGAPEIADIVALAQNPQGIVATYLGNGTGTFTMETGFFFGGGRPIGYQPVAIVTVANQASTFYSDVAILDYNSGMADDIYVLNVSANLMTVTSSASEQWTTITPGLGTNTPTVAFGVYYPLASQASSAVPGAGAVNFGFITANPLKTFPDDQDFGVSLPLNVGGDFLLAPFKTAGYYITAGSGGSSESGAGGAGGSLGKSLTVGSSLTNSGTVSTGTGTLSIQFPTTDFTYEGEASFVAGNGGNGFTSGGAGGSLVGISVTYGNATEYTGLATLTAGNGGEGLTGTGGAGGSLGQLYIISGEEFVAGNGGIGVIGGAGGSILGNTQENLLTAQSNAINLSLILDAGAGATGIDGGGNGGNINSFVDQFNPPVGAVSGELLEYLGGAGGNAVAGPAGAGGSILNSSPSVVINNFMGDIFLEGGSGGSGLRGGGGGSVNNFSQVSTIKDIPSSFTVLGGFGGNGVIDAGGTGGSIANLNVSASGNGVDFTVNYNRTVAGAGGFSAGAVGGAGGSVSNINTASVAATAQNVVVAGAGGAGLTAGGPGGSVVNATADAGSTTGKVVIIAGDGGSSSSAKPLVASNPMDVALAIGGVNGPGGNGGSIIDFTQSLSTSTHVDLIAGNGGATLNHSFAAGNASVDNSGIGGSISDVLVQGSIGNSSPNVAILSYNNILAGQTMQDFVDSYILGDESGVMTDSIGNVGLVAGAAGAVEGGLPSNNGINGSVTNVGASNIMSMIAGNVDQVQLIQSLVETPAFIQANHLQPDGLISATGIFGAPKLVSALGYTSQIVPGALNYISPNGLLTDTPLPGGGALIDGAIVAKNIRTIYGLRDFEGTEV